MQTEFKGRTFNVVGTFGGYTVLQHVCNPLDGYEGIIIDADRVAEAYGNQNRYLSWQHALEGMGVELFGVYTDCRAVYWSDNPDGAVREGIRRMMGPDNPMSCVVLDNDGNTHATLARTCDGVSVVWSDTSVTHWRQLTWVVVGGEPVALVGLNGTVQQV